MKFLNLKIFEQRDTTSHMIYSSINVGERRLEIQHEGEKNFFFAPQNWSCPDSGIYMGEHLPCYDHVTPRSTTHTHAHAHAYTQLPHPLPSLIHAHRSLGCVTVAFSLPLKITIHIPSAYKAFKIQLNFPRKRDCS